MTLEINNDEANLVLQSLDMTCKQVGLQGAGPLLALAIKIQAAMKEQPAAAAE